MAGGLICRVKNLLSGRSVVTDHSAHELGRANVIEAYAFVKVISRFPVTARVKGNRAQFPPCRPGFGFAHQGTANAFSAKVLIDHQCLNDSLDGLFEGRADEYMHQADYVFLNFGDQHLMIMRARNRSKPPGKFAIVDVVSQLRQERLCGLNVRSAQLANTYGLNLWQAVLSLRPVRAELSKVPNGTLNAKRHIENLADCKIVLVGEARSCLEFYGRAERRRRRPVAGNFSKMRWVMIRARGINRCHGLRSFGAAA